MADRKPIVGPGQLDELSTADRIVAAGITTANADLILEDATAGSVTLSDLVAGGGTITLTGDATGSGTGTIATTIASDAVTYAKMQNVSAASRLLGRGSAGGSGDVEEITIGSGLSMSGTTLSASGGGGGEANTASNVGATGTGLFKQKTGVDLEFYKIDGVNGLTESVISDVLTLDATALLPRDGSRAMTAALNMATFGLVDLGYVAISPTAIAAGQNNYAPTGWNTADIVRLTLTGSQTITGFVAPTSGGAVRKVLVNIDTTDTLTIAHESASSTAANRVTAMYASPVVIPPGGAVVLHYDATSSRWRPIAGINETPVLIDAKGRSVQLTNITTPVYPGYDVNIGTLDTSYFTYSAGIWTCVKAHTSIVTAIASYKVNAGAVSCEVISDITINGASAQVMSSSAYSTTDLRGQVVNQFVKTWAASDTLRIQYSTAAGACDIYANQNSVFITRVSG